MPVLVEGRSEDREFGECGDTSIEVEEGLLGLEYTGSFGGNGGGLDNELNLNAFTVDIVVRVQPTFDPTLLIIDGRILFYLL